MNKIRKRITGQREQTPRGLAIVTVTGERWVLEDYDPTDDLLGNEVTAEGTVVGIDRLRVEWFGSMAG